MRSVTALSMLENGVGVKRLSFGCRLIDKCTGGGVQLQGINEIVGEAGAGKTQFALTLSLQCHLNESMGGLNAATAYLCCGEGTFPVRRLEQLSRSYERKTSIPYATFMESVHIEQCHNADDVLDTLMKKIPEMCKSKLIRLIVIDSIAGMVRTEYDTSSTKEMALRTSLLFKIAKELKWLSDTFNLCIVVINQVTASGFQNNDNLLFERRLDQDSCNPALGLAWTHCINTRIILRRDSSNMRSIGNDNNEDNECENDENNVNSWKNGNKITNNSQGQSQGQSQSQVQGQSKGLGSNRLLTLEFSPCNQKASCRYEINNDGVFGLL